MHVSYNEWILALLEFKSWPKFDEGIFESYVHLNLVVLALFEGYTVDLAEMLAQELNLEFEIRVVKDGQYGVSDPSIPGGWTGMIGELVRNEADVAISPLTINAQREQVVDFR